MQDIDDAKELMVELSHYPCQIVVIGVADAQYDQFLDLNQNVVKDRNNNACCRRMTTFIKLQPSMQAEDVAQKAL